MPGRFLEEFVPGTALDHGEVAMRQQDNEAFCRLTRNTQPLHLDPVAAAKTPFGRVLVNGLYTMSLAVGLSVPDTTEGTLVANLGYEDVRHPEPVFPGDVLRFTTEVTAVRPSSKPGRGIVTFTHRATNQAGKEVCRFQRIVMVRSRSGASAGPEATS